MVNGGSIVKKLLIGISVFIIALFVLGVIICGVNVGIGTESGSTIAVPDGFNSTNIGKNTIVIYNNESNYTVWEITNRSMESIFEEYKQEYANDTVSINSMDVDGVNVSGLDLTIKGEYIHTNYYYEKNGILYHIFPDGKYDSETLKDLVKSTDKKFF